MPGREKVSFQMSEAFSPSDLVSWQAHSEMLNIAFIFPLRLDWLRSAVVFLHPGKRAPSFTCLQDCLGSIVIHLCHCNIWVFGTFPFGHQTSGRGLPTVHFKGDHS